MNNIDEDIKIVEKLKDKRWESYTRPSIFQLDFEEKQAISNVLKALEGKDCVIETQAHNEDVYEELVEKLEKELETYKKIAEKIAEKFTEFGYYDDTCMVSGLVKCAKCNDFDLCKQCIIDWARKEVEKEC